MSDDLSAAGSVVEILGDGIGASYCRFIVGANDRDAAVKQ